MLPSTRITKELQDTLLSNDKIANVYFDSSGRHYFTAHELIQSADNTEKKFYGQGTFSHKIIIPGKTNIDQLKEDVAKGDPQSLIADTLTRKEVLDFDTKPADDRILTEILNLSPDKLVALRAFLNGEVSVPAPEKAPMPPIKK